MNTATKNLENDHVHILKLIDVMEQITIRENPDTNHLDKIVDLIRNFVKRMADNALSESDNKNLLNRFAEAEKNHFQSADSDKYTEQIKELASFYKV